MPITALYAALLGPLLVVLAVRVIGLRRRLKVAMGDGGHPEIARAIRVHANCAEYVPIALVLMALAESVAAPPVLLHAAGVVLVVGRCSHAYGMSQAKENFSFRAAGMMLTFGVIMTLAVSCLVGALIASLR